MQREWIVHQPVDVPDAVRRAAGDHPLLARLLVQRGYSTGPAAQAFLDPDAYVPVAPQSLPGIARAAAVVHKVRAARGRVRVWGDFDADGETATAVLVEALGALGVQVDYQLPQRHEGHGLNQRAVQECLRDGVALLITVDTGIDAVDLVRQAIDSGLKVIVTDHHDLPNVLPPADAVVNPKLLPQDHPARELSGVGVAYMLACALLDDAPDGQAVLDGLLDLVAIGLIGDVAAQPGDVRYLVQRGLRVLRATARTGLRAMLELAGSDVAHADEVTVSYVIAPRLNAAGRLNDATLGVRLLLTRDSAEANQIAQQLEAINLDRQARTEALWSQVMERLRQDSDIARRPAIVLEGEAWEAGVLGPVASRLAHDYDRPAVLIAHTLGGISSASARSVVGVDIHAAIASQRQLLVREGGHPMAAGFAIKREDVAAFTAGLLEAVAAQAVTRPTTVELQVDAEVPWSELGLELARALGRLRPYGPGNQEPCLVARAATMVRSEDVSRKRETNHRRLYLTTESGEVVRVIWFNAGDLPEAGETVDLALRVGRSLLRGEERLDLTLVAWCAAEMAVVRDSAELVSGLEVVDWRPRSGAQALLVELRRKHGEDLAVWSEGLEPPLEDTLTRIELRGRSAAVLVVVTPPPEPATLRRVLSDTKARLVYLLPPIVLMEDRPAQFARRVAGMVRVALNVDEGFLDTERMAARLGTRRSAVVAAVRMLEAAGKLTLETTQGGLVAHAVISDGRAGQPEHRTDPERDALVDASREALAHLLAETAAYRRFYASGTLAELFSGPEHDDRNKSRQHGRSKE